MRLVNLGLFQLAMVGFGWGCGGSSSDDGSCQPGTIGCVCIQGTCDVGLNCSDNVCLGPQGDGDGDGDGDGGTQAPECQEYLECVAAASPDTFDETEKAYGPESPCWDSAEAAEACAMQCEEALAELAELVPNQPACGGDVECAPTGCDPEMGGAECHCMGDCVGACEHAVPAPCAGECQGECTGTCDTCDGACQDDGGGTILNCAGSCDGTCLGTCLLETPGPCNASCAGSCCEQSARGR